jgi:FkbM family methyltransferase
MRSRIRDSADRLGYIAEKKSLDNTLEIRRSRLLASLGITTVLDVGANVGVYGEALRAYGYVGRLVSFEPLGAAYRALEARAAPDPLWEVHKLALGDVDGSAEINVAASDPWSSLLPTDPRAREPERLERVRTETVRTARLDSLPEVLGHRTWLKLDVQGFENCMRSVAPVRSWTA